MVFKYALDIIIMADMYSYYKKKQTLIMNLQTSDVGHSYTVMYNIPHVIESINFYDNVFQLYIMLQYV